MDFSVSSAFGPRGLGDLGTPWRAFVRAFYGEPLDADEAAIFRQCTGLDAPRAGGYSTAAVAVGRRAGKSHVASRLAALHPLRSQGFVGKLRGGRNVLVVQQDLRAGEGVLLDYIREAFNSPLLAGQLESATASTVKVRGGGTIRVLPAREGAVRGWGAGLVVLDEWDHFQNSERRSLSRKVLRSIRPVLFGVPGGKLLILSSPGAVGGAMHDLYLRHWAKPGDTLFWRASALVMRPDLLDDPQLAALREDDPAAFDREVQAEFTADSGSLVDHRQLAEVVRAEGASPHVPGVRYCAAFDVGGRRDGSAGAIGHRETVDGRTVAHVDLVWHRPAPHAPEDAVRAFAEVLKRYGLRKVWTDRGKDDLTRLVFRECGVSVEAPVAATSDNHEAMEHAVASRRVSLPRHEVLLREIRGLRRIKGGVDHAGGGHDDAAAAVSHLVAVLLAKGRGSGDLGITILGEIGAGRRAEPEAGGVRWVTEEPLPPAVNGVRWLTTPQLERLHGKDAMPSPVDDPVGYRAWSKRKHGGRDERVS
jgi:hypothetical protein